MSGKLEPRLKHEILEARAAGEVNRTIPVIIEHAEAASASQEDSRGGIHELEGHVHRLQKGIVEQLSEFGAPDIRQSVLANLITASLRPEHIEAVAARDDVRIVRLNREDQVTC